MKTSYIQSGQQVQTLFFHLLGPSPETKLAWHQYQELTANGRVVKS